MADTADAHGTHDGIHDGTHGGMDNASPEEEHQLSLSMANALINYANDRMEEGAHPLVIASALRHAAANFTAFAWAVGTDGALDYEFVCNDFHHSLEYYDARHRQSNQDHMTPKTGLERLVEQVKGE